MSNGASIADQEQTFPNDSASSEAEGMEPSQIDWKGIWKPLSLITGAFLVVFLAADGQVAVSRVR